MPELTENTLVGSAMTPAWLERNIGDGAAEMMQQFGIAIAMGFEIGDRRNVYAATACPKCDKVHRFTLDFKGIMTDGRDPMGLMVESVRGALAACGCTHAPERLQQALELYRPVFEPYITRPSGLIIPRI